MENFNSIFDGLMLSDGSLVRRKVTYNALYKQECIHCTYMLYVKRLLNENRIVCSDYYPKERTYSERKTKNPQRSGFMISSCVSAYLTTQQERWYRNGVKIVPEDLILNPETCRNWYLGDGWLSWNTKWDTLHFIGLATEGFSIEDTDILLEKTKELGLPFKRDKKRNLFLKASLAQDFLAYIGSSPEYCFSYKWEIYNKKDYIYKKRNCPCAAKTISSDTLYTFNS